jgi:hypothetical protein
MYALFSVAPVLKVLIGNGHCHLQKNTRERKLKGKDMHKNLIIFQLQLG